MQKRRFPTELSYFLGLIILALGTALMEKANFGMSMVVAPAYLVHLKLSERFAFFSFGMAEYLLQALLLVLLGIGMRRFRLSYLLSLLTAVIYGLMLDGSLWLVAPLDATGFVVQGICYLAGMLLCSLGVSLLFHTYFSPEAYELVVKEISRKTGRPIPLVKTIYDCVSCAVGVILSFCFFGFGVFEGVKLGTILCALVNGWLIGQCAKLLENRFEFVDRLPFRPFFER